MKVAIIQTAFLGDVVLTSPFVDALHKYYGDSLELYYIVSKNKEGVFENDPRVKKTIIYDKKAKDKGFRGILNLSRQLSRLNIDVLFNLHRFTRSHLLSIFTKAKYKYAFYHPLFNFFYTDTVKRNNTIHEVLRNAEFVNFIGECNYDFSYLSNEVQHSVFFQASLGNKLKSILGEYIVVAPGTIGRTKAWPKEYYAELMKIILERMSYKIILLGASGDLDICDFIESVLDKNVIAKLSNNFIKELESVGTNIRILNLCASTTVRELIDIIAMSKLVITNDSAPLHIASLTARNVVGFFGPTVEKFGFFPYTDKGLVLENNSIKCRPCSIHGARPCKYRTNECLRSITAEFAFSQIIKRFKL